MLHQIADLEPGRTRLDHFANDQTLQDTAQRDRRQIPRRGYRIQPDADGCIYRVMGVPHQNLPRLDDRYLRFDDLEIAFLEATLRAPHKPELLADHVRDSLSTTSFDSGRMRQHCSRISRGVTSQLLVTLFFCATVPEVSSGRLDR